MDERAEQHFTEASRETFGNILLRCENYRPYLKIQKRFYKTCFKLSVIRTFQNTHVSQKKDVDVSTKFLTLKTYKRYFKYSYVCFS